MFREMRRFKQALSEDETKKILEDGKTGVIAVSGDDDYPYTVPINYVFHNGKIYMHCAKTGHKIDALNRNKRVSFCVIGQDTVAPEKFTSLYKSAVVFGQARLLSEGSEYDEAIYALSKKYSPNETEERIMEEIQDSAGRFFMIAIDIDHMTGKEAIELTRMRTNNKE